MQEAEKLLYRLSAIGVSCKGLVESQLAAGLNRQYAVWLSVRFQNIQVWHQKSGWSEKVGNVGECNRHKLDLC